ncbi:MAG: Na+/H+ antiporter NhaA [Promethearchaeota archaeon]
MTIQTKSVDQALIDRIIRPFKEFTKTEELSGLLLVFCTILALILSNLFFPKAYSELWKTYFTVNLGALGLSKPLFLWINDGLMAIFFFVVSLEIKRELIVGELSSIRKASLPFFAALGGMLVPAAIYFLFDFNSPESINGWGIPMATDIAFTLGILALLGKRAPFPLKVFITSLAIIDDIGAIIVIAIFYSSNIQVLGIILGAIILGLLIFTNRINIINPIVYGILGIALWFMILQSGIHATIAGVLVAFCVPAKNRIDADQFVAESLFIIEEFQTMGKCGDSVLLNPRQQSAIKTLETACQKVEAPLQRFERNLHFWVGYAILPIFIFANAGVFIGDVPVTIHPIELGIFFGLVIGKPLGITLGTWIAIKTGITSLPRGLTWTHIIGVAALAGIGFTMSLFIGGLAITDPTLIVMMKFSILVASLVSATIGIFILSRTQPIEEQIQEFNCK